MQIRIPFSYIERNFKVPSVSTIKGKDIYRIEPGPEICVPLLLRKVRTESGLSQSVVAKKLNIAYQTYQLWESPKAANPTVKQLDKVAKAIGKKLVLEIVQKDKILFFPIWEDILQSGSLDDPPDHRSITPSFGTLWA